MLRCPEKKFVQKLFSEETQSSEESIRLEQVEVVVEEIRQQEELVPVFVDDLASDVVDVSQLEVGSVEPDIDEKGPILPNLFCFNTNAIKL